jgi:hypothetical protein
MFGSFRIENVGGTRLRRGWLRGDEPATPSVHATLPGARSRSHYDGVNMSSTLHENPEPRARYDAGQPRTVERRHGIDSLAQGVFRQLLDAVLRRE